MPVKIVYIYTWVGSLHEVDGDKMQNNIQIAGILDTFSLS